MRAKSLKPQKENVSNSTPVVRSFILQLCLRNSDDNFTNQIEDFVNANKGFVKTEDQLDIFRHVPDLFICIPDIFQRCSSHVNTCSRHVKHVPYVTGLRHVTVMLGHVQSCYHIILFIQTMVFG